MFWYDRPIDWDNIKPIHDNKGHVKVASALSKRGDEVVFAAIAYNDENEECARALVIVQSEGFLTLECEVYALAFGLEVAENYGLTNVISDRMQAVLLVTGERDVLQSARLGLAVKETVDLWNFMGAEYKISISTDGFEGVKELAKSRLSEDDSDSKVSPSQRLIDHLKNDYDIEIINNSLVSLDENATAFLLPYYTWMQGKVVYPSILESLWNHEASKAQYIVWRPYGERSSPLSVSVIGDASLNWYPIDLEDGGVEPLIAISSQLRLGEEVNRIGSGQNGIRLLRGTWFPLEEWYVCGDEIFK